MSTEPIPNRQNCVQIANPKSIDFYQVNCYHDKITTKKEKIMIDIPPQLEQVIVAQATAQGLSPTALLEKTSITDEYDDNYPFNLERMQKALGYADSVEEVLANSVEVPKSALKDFDSFKRWIGRNNA